MKYSMAPTAARKEPMTKVMEMTALILMPMSWAVSKSLAAARMAMPILVWLMRYTRATTSRMVRAGVTRVTRLVDAPSRDTFSEIQGMGLVTGWGTPPVM